MENYYIKSLNFKYPFILLLIVLQSAAAYAQGIKFLIPDGVVAQ
jgi:hypothetical protein